MNQNKIGKKEGICEKCKKRQIIHSKGLCTKCYNSEYYRKIKDRYKDRYKKNKNDLAKYQRNWREQHTGYNAIACKKWRARQKLKIKEKGK